MKIPHGVMSVSLVASLLASGSLLAQGLPDEINHPQSLKTLQGLHENLSSKTADYDRLSAQKAELLGRIANLEKEQRDLPVKGSELESRIARSRAEVDRLNRDLAGLQGVLDTLQEDLQKQSAIIQQLQSDFNAGSSRREELQRERNQQIGLIQGLNQRLQNDRAREGLAAQNLEAVGAELQNASIRLTEVNREKGELNRDFEKSRREVGPLKNALARNSGVLIQKRPALEQAKARLGTVEARRAPLEAKVAQLGSEIRPQEKKLEELQEQLAKASPEIANLTKENRDLEKKIDANKAKVKAAGLPGQIERRGALQKEVASLTAERDDMDKKQIQLSEDLKPELAQIQELRVKIRELMKAGGNGAEVIRLRAEAEAIEERLKPKQREIQRLKQTSERASLALYPKATELTALSTSVTALEAQVASLQKEISEAETKVAANEKVIEEARRTNAPLAKEIADLEASLKSLTGAKEEASRQLAQLKHEEAAQTREVASLTQEVSKIENENREMSRDIEQMDKTVKEYPQAQRRLELHSRQLEELIGQKRQQLGAEEAQFARARGERLNSERSFGDAQRFMETLSANLEETERLVLTIRNKINQESRELEGVNRYQQETRAKFDAARNGRDQYEREIGQATTDLAEVDKTLEAINQELPKQQGSLASLNPRVEAALALKLDLEKRVSEANGQYQGRLSLYQRYLAEAKGLGEERATVATADGSKAGSVEGRTKAQRLARENALSAGKWEAMRRGYVRGEISGYGEGFDLGLASSPDAQRGEEEGTVAGQKRAQNHAQMVLKPQYYLAELARRLTHDEVNKSHAPVRAAGIAALARADRQEEEAEIPELEVGELSASAQIVSALDSMIEQAAVEIREVMGHRSQISDPRNVYTKPGPGENAAKANCAGVYKSVSEFVEACKASYAPRYTYLYQVAHENSFNQDYAGAFRQQLEAVLNSELVRLFPVYYKEAAGVGREVGLSAGKKEIFDQVYDRTEKVAYARTLPAEDSRASVEAVEMVGKHLATTGSLTLKGGAKIKTSHAYGLAPGASAELRMTLKNIGSKASGGTSLVKVTEASSNVVLTRREAALAPVAALSSSDLTVLDFKVSENAIPGSKVVLSGEIVHPGNDYRSGRTEAFKVEGILAVDPSIDAELDYENDPKISGLFGAVKKQDLTVTVRPKFAGVDEGYLVEVAEVGTNYADFAAESSKTERLGKGVSKRIGFSYKLAKNSKGRNITFKVTIKNGTSVVKSFDLKVTPK